MTKRKSIILIAVVCVLIGGVIMFAQLFNPLEQSPNENLFKNSGWQSNHDGWVFAGNLEEKVDTTKVFETCNSIISDFKFNTTQNKYISQISIAQPNIKAKGYNTRNFCVSGFVESEKSISTVTCEINVVFKYDDDTSEELSSIANLTQLNSNTLKFSYNIIIPSNKKLKEIWIEQIKIYQENISSENCGYLWLYQPKLEYGSTATPYRPALTDNVAWDYDTPNNSFQSSKIGTIQNILTYKYQKSFTSVGTFSMSFSKWRTVKNELNIDVIELNPTIALIKENTIIFIKNDENNNSTTGDWLLVENINLVNDIYTVTGVDSKGLLRQRLTLYDIAQATGTMGFDVCVGSTEAVIKHYIVNNLVNPLDDNRKVIGLTIADNQDRGLANDTYMSRLDPLNEVVEKLCKFANIGYDIPIDLLNNKMIFDIVNVTDKSASQRDRHQVIFEKCKGNVVSVNREYGNSNEKNAFYATKSGGTLEADAITILCTPTATVSKGINRREMQLNVSCDSIADIALYAKQQMTPYAKTDSFAVATSDVDNYNKLFFIGDLVTLREVKEKIGGRNLVLNSGFKTNANWFGTAISSLPSTTGEVIIPFISGAENYLIQTIPCIAGQQYAVSIKIKTVGIVATAGKGALLITNGTNRSPFNTIITGDTPYTLYTSIVVPTGTTMTIGADVYFASAGTAYFKEIKVEKGKTATPYLPAPEDNIIADGDVVLDTIINGAIIEYANGKKSVTLEFGEGKPKPLNLLNNKINNKGV